MSARLLLAAVALGAQVTTAQVANANTNQFSIVGSSGIASQQIFLADPKKVIIVDKTENNGNNLNINGHPAYSVVWDTDTYQPTPLDTITNAFCAGGTVLANGTWLNTGGNSRVGPGGLPPGPDMPDSELYESQAGGTSVRFMEPCLGDAECSWVENPNYMTTARWYPALETLQDGSAILVGGCLYGGYVNEASQSNPTVEFIPPKGNGQPIGLNFLLRSLPANLYTLTWLLPSGNLFLQATYATSIYDWQNNVEHPLADIPDGVKTYPSSGATAMLPLRPENNYQATLLFCGGNNLKPDQFVATWNIAAYPTIKSCTTMTPDVNTTWGYDDDAPQGRTMGQFIILPNGMLFMSNGAATGTAAYGNTTWAIGQSFADNPVLTPALYNPRAPAGSRWTTEGLGASTVPRLYHSVALLMPDGAVMISGSNPVSDYVPTDAVINGVQYKYTTEYRTEMFYPSYYNERRPQPQGLPNTINYGGASFNVTLSSDDLSGSANKLSLTEVVIIRPGFSTHGMNMGMRFVQLNNTASWDSTSNTGTLYVSQLPPNAAVLAPGPALLFVVVDGVPSIGAQIMVGSGTIGTQPTAPNADLPPSTGFVAEASTSTSNTNSVAAKDGDKSSATSLMLSMSAVIFGTLAFLLC